MRGMGRLRCYRPAPAGQVHGVCTLGSRQEPGPHAHCFQLNVIHVAMGRSLQLPRSQAPCLEKGMFKGPGSFAPSQKQADNEYEVLTQDMA